jgi:hypothetical protein
MLPFLKQLGGPAAEATNKRITAMREEGRETAKKQKKKIEK